MQVGTAACEKEMLKMSVNTSASWEVQSLSACPGILSGPAALQGLILSRVLLTLVWVTLRGASPGLLLLVWCSERMWSSQTG